MRGGGAVVERKTFEAVKRSAKVSSLLSAAASFESFVAVGNLIPELMS